MAITERPIEIEGLDVETVFWDRGKEVENLDQIDIGMMPLSDDEWSKGKCGFKGIQYMSLSIPTLMSPVGVNPEIIQDGVNGYLPRSTEEWVSRISDLVDSEILRKEIGDAGRKTIEDRYSVKFAQGKLLDMLNELTGKS
jgi:glycosyltransferase involved in cell wall biosynthesis